MGKKPPPIKKNAIKQQMEEAKKHESQMEKQQKDKHIGKNPIEVQLKEMAEMVQEQNHMLEKYEASLIQLENVTSKHEVQLKQLEKDKNSMKKTIEEQGKKHEDQLKRCKELNRTMEMRMDQLEAEKNAEKKLAEAKMAQMERGQARQEGRVDQLALQNVALTKLVREQAKKLAEVVALKGTKENLDEIQGIEYANVIGVPAVTNLFGNYDRQRLLNLIQHGNAITKSIDIQCNQQLNDPGLLQSIVDLLASTEKPEKLVGDVRIVFDSFRSKFKWPKNAQLKLKHTYDMHLKLGGASTHMTEYELVNNGSRFTVLLCYISEFGFNREAFCFDYQRLE